MAERDDTEERFRALLREAEPEADYLRRLVAEVAGPTVARTDFPLATLMPLVDWAATLFHGGVVLLGDRHIAPAAQVQIRSLVELWANLIWIHGPDEPPDPAAVACRAAKFDVARFDELLHSVRDIHTDVVQGGDAVRVWRTLQTTRDGYKAAHDAMGCDPDIPQLRGSITARIEQLEKQVGENWLLDLWRFAATTAAHGSAAELTKGKLAFGEPANFETRGKMLGRLFWLFNGAGITALAIVNPPQQETFRQRMRALGESPVLLQAGQGHLD